MGSGSGVEGGIYNILTTLGYIIDFPQGGRKSKNNRQMINFRSLLI